MAPPISLPEGGGFFWAYYYPSHGSKVCFHSDKVSGGINVCCPGDILCGLVNKP